MKTTVCLACCAFVLAGTARAQNPKAFTAKGQCTKADPTFALGVGDEPVHAIMLGKVQCTWLEGAIAGDTMKTEEDTFVADAMGITSNDRGYGVGHLASGALYFVRFEGTTTLEIGTPVDEHCSWAFTGGTGKFRTIRGQGTCTVTYSADGLSLIELNGAYDLGSPSPSR